MKLKIIMVILGFVLLGCAGSIPMDLAKLHTGNMEKAAEIGKEKLVSWPSISVLIRALVGGNLKTKTVKLMDLLDTFATINEAVMTDADYIQVLTLMGIVKYHIILEPAARLILLPEVL